MKRHKWKMVSKGLVDYYDWRHCKHCNLEKATNKSGWNIHETYYFHSDENGNIVRYGLNQLRVPYGCGELIDYNLEEDLFEI